MLLTAEAPQELAEHPQVPRAARYKSPPAATLWEQEQQNPDLPQGFSTHQVLLNVLIRVHIRVGRFEVSL